MSVAEEDNGITLSENHGVNPSIQKCFLCQEDMGVVLFGQLKPSRDIPDPEAPREVCLGPDSEPCTKCQDLMGHGIIVISVDEKKSADDLQNPWRTGGWVVVKEEVFHRLLEPGSTLLESIVEKRVCFMPDDAWDQIGFPRGEIR
jgi:hypothetical protein